MVTFEELLTEIKKRNSVQLEQAESLLALADIPGESETRISFLNLAERQIEQPAIFNQWVQLTIQEQDAVVKEHLLRALSSFCHSGKLKKDHADLLLSHLDVIVPLIEQLSLRVTVLNILSALLVFDGSKVGNRLGEVYASSDSESFKYVIFGLIYWIRHSWLQAPQFLLERFNDTPLAYRPGILTYLLKRNAVPIADQLKFLTFVPEFDYSRFIITEFHLESTTKLPHELETRFIQMMQEDPIVECRINAAIVLIRHGKGLQEALQQLKVSDQPEFRAVLFQELTAVSTGSEEFLDSLLSFLKVEKDPVLFQDILNQLYSKIADESAFGENLRSGLLELTWKNLSVDLAEIVFNTLGLALKSHVSLREHFVKAYKNQNQDELRACILGWLAGFSESEPSVQELVKTGIQSSSFLVRKAALQGIFVLPAVQKFSELILAATPLLTDKDIDSKQRQRLASKISVIGQFPEDAKSKLKAVLPFIEDVKIREKLDANLSRSQAASKSTDEPDWDEWFRKVTQEKSVKGIFPAVYISFDLNPQKSRNILEVVIANRKELSLGFFSDPLAIFEFLKTKGMADEGLLKWVWEYLLSEKDHMGEKTRRCLGILKGSPAAISKRDEMWKLMEKENLIDICGSVVILDTFFVLYEGEKGFLAVFKKQVEVLESPTLFENCVKLFEDGSSFAWVKDCLMLLAERMRLRPALVDASRNSSQMDRFNRLLEKFDIKLEESSLAQINSVQPQQPGLLDD